MKDSLPIALKQLVRFLEKCEKEFGLQYYIVGGILVPMYSTFRTTQDIDFVINLTTSKISLQEYIKLLEKIILNLFKIGKVLKNLRKNQNYCNISMNKNISNLIII